MNAERVLYFECPECKDKIGKAHVIVELEKETKEVIEGKERIACPNRCPPDSLLMKLAASVAIRKYELKQAKRAFEDAGWEKIVRGIGASSD